QRHFVVLDAQPDEGRRPRAPDHLLQRFVRRARRGQQMIARAQDTEQAGADGVGPRGDLRPYQRGLAPEHTRKQAFQSRPADVVGPVAGAAGKMLFPDALLPESGQDPLLVVTLNLAARGPFVSYRLAGPGDQLGEAFAVDAMAQSRIPSSCSK